MRRALLILAAVGLFFFAAPAFAQDEYLGTFSVGLGGAFGEEDVGPWVLSGKYWDAEWELGAEVFWSGDDMDEYDQIGFAWLVYRYDVWLEEDSATYVGIGGGGIFEETMFANNWGPVAVIGWDAQEWGLEFKYGYFDPSVFSICAYWNFL